MTSAEAQMASVCPRVAKAAHFSEIVMKTTKAAASVMPFRTGDGDQARGHEQGEQDVPEELADDAFRHHGRRDEDGEDQEPEHGRKAPVRLNRARDRVLRTTVATVLDQTWKPVSMAPSTKAETLFDRIEELEPKSDEQRILKSQAISMVIDLGQARWLMFAQSGSSISTPLLVVVVFWLTINFISFGLFTSRNASGPVTKQKKSAPRPVVRTGEARLRQTRKAGAGYFETEAMMMSSFLSSTATTPQAVALP